MFLDRRQCIEFRLRMRALRVGREPESLACEGVPCAVHLHEFRSQRVGIVIGLVVWYRFLQWEIAQ